LFNIDAYSENEVLAKLQVRCNSFETPAIGDVIRIAPKADKNEYKGMRKSVNAWKKETPQTEGLKAVLLNQCRDGGWKLPVNALKTQFCSLAKFNEITLQVRYIKSRLNEKQVRIFTFFLLYTHLLIYYVTGLEIGGK